jgi:serine/threonine-protein kinase
VLRLERTLGPTPIHAEPLPMGSYLCVLRHPDRAEVRYPVLIEREQHWDCVPPEGGASVPIHLPRRSELGTDDCYVPAGWCWLGGDPQARGSMTRRRSWVDGHVIRRFPVTNREYIAFLESLVRAGRGEEALRHAPRERGGTAGEQGALIYGFDGERFSLRPDADGDVWEPEWPVFMVDWEGATAYAAWEAARSGHPWRLPGEVAWEKAARGVDGRWYPWGDAFDPSWACLRDSHEGRRAPAPVTAFPIDESPYGVRGLAGNACDWCADAYLPDGPAPAGGRAPTPSAVEAAGSGMYRIIRGGAWYNDAPSGRAAARSNDHPGVRNSRQSFRIARSSE